jgi:uncharacterized protein YjbI with pentapeptide repeats
MAIREYSIEEREGLLKALREAFEEYYKNSEKRRLSLNKSKQELGSDFFRQLDDDSKKGNVEKGYTIARSVLESFFKDETKKSFNDKTPVKINALISFYNQHVYDIEHKEPRVKEKIEEKEVLRELVNDEKENKENKVLDRGNDETPLTDVPIKKYQESFIWWKHLSIPIAILSIGLLAFFGIQNYSGKQDKIAKERIIVENANEQSKSRAILLSDIYKFIIDELDGYLDDSKKRLSEGLIGKIIALTKSLTPYEYKKDGQIVKYSPQRAELFSRLIRLDLNENDYHKIFKGSDFSFSDFSNMDLSNIDLVRLIHGLEGSFGMNSQLLITSVVRPNLSSSFFGNCNLTNARLFGNFNNSDFSGARIENTFFDWSEAKNANFSNGRMVMHVEHSDFRHSNFQNNILYGFFKDSDFRGVIFDGSTFYPFDAAVNPYLDKENPVENVLYNGNGDIFHNTFLSSGQTMTRYRFEMLDTKNSFGGYLARSFFKEEYKTEDGSWTQSIIVPIDLLRANKGKDTAIIDPRFHFIEKDHSLRDFLEEWKNNYAGINNYIVRTNDNFNPDNCKVSRSTHIFSNNIIHIKVDTMHVVSSKDSYCYRFERKSKPYCPNIVALGEIEPPASFHNCKFFGAISGTKMMGVSFKGSYFNSVFFNNSELFDVDMRNTTGNFYLDSATVLDRIKIDRGSFLSSLKQQKNKILKSKFEVAGDSLSLQAYLEQKKIGKMIWSIDIQNALEKFRSILQMEKRLFTLENGKDYYVCDSLYLTQKKWSH